MGNETETDEVLLARVRDEGDRAAFACLYQRHAPAARRFARSLCGNDADAEDLTADVFTSFFASLRRGRGPSQLALPYVLASIRNRHWRTTARRTRESALVRTVSVGNTGCGSSSIVESDVLRAALATLPAEAQVLLWRTEVNDERLDGTVDRNGNSAHNDALHRHRARRALGTAYLAQHALPDGGLAGLDPECRSTLSHLAALVRNRIGARRRRRLEQHLAGCEHCTQARRRLELINTRLRAFPKLPWPPWFASLTSAIKVQASSWLGASAATLAGSSLAVAAVVPTARLLEHFEGTESQSAAAAASPAHEGATTQESAPGDRVGSDGTALEPGDPGTGANPLDVPPATADRSPPPAPNPPAPDGPTVIAALTGVPPGPASHHSVAEHAAPAVIDAPVGVGVAIAPSAINREDRGLDGGQGVERDASGGGNGPATVTNDRRTAPARGSNGEEQSNVDGQGEGASGGKGRNNTGSTPPATTHDRRNTTAGRSDTGSTPPATTQGGNGNTTPGRRNIAGPPAATTQDNRNTTPGQRNAASPPPAVVQDVNSTQAGADSQSEVLHSGYGDP